MPYRGCLGLKRNTRAVVLIHQVAPLNFAIPPCARCLPPTGWLEAGWKTPSACLNCSRASLLELVRAWLRWRCWQHMGACLSCARVSRCQPEAPLRGAWVHSTGSFAYLEALGRPGPPLPFHCRRTDVLLAAMRLATRRSRGAGSRTRAHTSSRSRAGSCTKPRATKVLAVRIE